jgi:hypothetical protein
MKLTLLVLPLVIVPIFLLNTGILSASAQGQSASVSQVSASSNVDLSSNQSLSLAAVAPVVETTSASVQNSGVSDNSIAPSASSAVLEQSATVGSKLNDFVATVENGQAGQVVGVYVPDVLSLKVAQQPANNPAYVNETLGYATQFRLAAQYGATGLLAHNYLSGALFSSLSTGQEVDVIYGDGSIRRYSILMVRRFQALNPTSPASNFVDLDDSSGAQISNADLFFQIYKGNRVVFQTCITANGNTSWGRLFVIATPIQ